MKFKTNLISWLMAGLMLTANVLLPVSVPKALAAGLSCADLVNPDKVNEYIITILEERIVPQNQTPAEQSKSNVDAANEGIFNCFRETTCNSVTEDKKTRKVCEQVKYVESCKPVSDNGSGGSVICQPVQVLYSKSGAGMLYSYVGLIYRWTAGTAGIVTVLYLVIGGIGIATAQGDSGRLEKAKERVMNSILGLVLLFLSALILYSINPNFFTR